MEGIGSERIGGELAVLASGLDHPVVPAAMSAAATATGMEVVFIGGLSEETFTFQRLHGSWDGLEEGLVLDRADSFCARLLGGAPTSTANAAAEPAYASTPPIDEFGVTSYVGVPIRDSEGRTLGTLCAIDHDPVTVGEDAVDILRDLAAVLAAHLQAAPPGVVIRRTPEGWAVQGAPDGAADPELTNAMILADLLGDDPAPGTRPRRPDSELDVVGQLRLSVTQLEHALAARVVVEQAIGVLAERQHLPPRAAFERLRRAARARGRRVHLLAREVVASSHTAGVPLPPELAGGRRI